MYDQLWSWVLGFVGLVGFYVVGKKIWWGWWVNIANQFLWAAYSFVTEQWGFLAVTFFYFTVFLKNAISWTKDHRSIKRAVKKVKKQLAVISFNVETKKQPVVAKERDIEKAFVQAMADFKTKPIPGKRRAIAHPLLVGPPLVHVTPISIYESTLKQNLVRETITPEIYQELIEKW